MDSDKLASMYSEIVNGISKKDSRYAKGKEGSALWDQVSKEVAAQKKKQPETVFSIPNEMP